LRQGKVNIRSLETRQADMPRTAEHNEALRAATRATVQTAAVRVFARQGFAASNMRAIATQAGLSVGAIYRHYATKEELFDDLLDQAVAGLHSTTKQFKADAPPLETVRNFTAEYLADVVSGSGAAEFFMVINHGFTTDTPAGTSSRLVDAHRELWWSFSSLVRRGQALGQFAEGDPERMTVSYFAMLTGITTMSVALQDDLALPGVDLVLRVLTGKADR
jgi:AcrR family transcriptional regulator